MVVGSAKPAHAIQATWSDFVETFVIDDTCPDGFSCVDRGGSPPNSPIVDSSVSTNRVTNITYFTLASLTAFINVGDALLAQGVAQSDALRTPDLSGCCTAGGEGTFNLFFDVGTVPLAVDIFETAHRVGPEWGFLTGPGGIEFSGFPSDLFVSLPTTAGDGDVSYAYHTVLAPNSGQYRLNVLAAAVISGGLSATTEETKVVWELRVTPVPWPPTALLVCFSLALLVGRHSTKR